jgi:hypothetical protein
MVLSDNAFNYPFLRLAAVFGKFQYSLFWSRNELFVGAYYNYHHRKYNALSHLSWLPKNGIEISIFESIEWPANTPDQNNFTINLFNPIIFWRSIQYGLNDEKNILLGFNGKLRLSGFSQIYSQFALDRADFQQIANNNFAFQLGFKHFDLFHQKFINHHLFLQVELNYIAPYTYSFADSTMAFTHYNQPIAHPTGTGLKESLLILSYSYKDISLNLTGSYIINSLDTANTNFGSDVFKSSAIYPDVVSHIGNSPGQGIQNNLFKFDAELIFQVNPAYKLQIFTKFIYRKNENELISNDSWVWSFGLRTNLNNVYYDF